jgi:uncharacterized protein (UPF0335 family)
MADKGDNSDVMLKRFAERIAGLMGQIQEIKDEVKTELEAAKASGLNTKALNKIVRELGMDEDKRQSQLEFEWEVDAYRKAVGLPTEVSVPKQEAA